MDLRRVETYLDELVSIVLNSGFVEDEYDIWAKSLVHTFIAAEVELPPNEKAVRTFVMEKQRADALFQFLSGLMSGTKSWDCQRTNRKFLALVQDAVRGVFDESSYKEGNDPLALLRLTLADWLIKADSLAKEKKDAINNGYPALSER